MELRRTRWRPRTYALIAVVAAPVVVAIVGVSQTGTTSEGPRSGTPTLGPSQSASRIPTESPTPHRLTAQEVVDDPHSTLVELIVSPEDPTTRASIWQLCQTPACEDNGITIAVALTDDGFAHRTVLPETGHVMWPAVRPMGPGLFYVDWGRRMRAMVDIHGSRTPVTRSKTQGPLADGERLVADGYGLAPPYAVDPVTGNAHRLSAPEGIRDLQRTPGGQLRGILFEYAEKNAAVMWSDDGGRTWANHPLLVDELTMYEMVPTVDDSTLAVLVGSDGATMFPLIAVLRSTDGGSSWERFALPDDPLSHGWGVTVLPDGRLLLNLDGWSDRRLSRPSVNPGGLWISDAQDWSKISPLRTGPPLKIDESGYTPISLLTTYQVAGQGRNLTRLLATKTGPQGGGFAGAYESADLGRTWAEVPVR